MSMNKLLSISEDFHQKYLLNSKNCLIYYQDVIYSNISGLSEEALLQSLLENYDHETNMHAQRIVFLVEAIACRLQLSENEVFLTCLAALLHDIGKAGIPREILQKPGPLDAHERQIVHSHPEIGRQMLIQAGGVFALLAPIVVAHHEHWDGKGYPASLAGEDIPLAARIIAVVDSYDAIFHHRVYHKGKPAIEACAELQRCAGSQYDPHIVAVFHSLLNEFPVGHTYSIHIPATDESELADAMCVVPSLQSGEYVPVSA